MYSEFPHCFLENAVSTEQLRLVIPKTKLVWKNLTAIPSTVTDMLDKAVRYSSSFFPHWPSLFFFLEKGFSLPFLLVVNFSGKKCFNYLFGISVIDFENTKNRFLNQVVLLLMNWRILTARYQDILSPLKLRCQWFINCKLN